jgi:hypothetical protein
MLTEVEPDVDVLAPMAAAHVDVAFATLAPFFFIQITTTAFELVLFVAVQVTVTVPTELDENGGTETVVV